MLVHRRLSPGIKFAGTHLFTWVERGTVGVDFLAQEDNSMSLARGPFPEGPEKFSHPESRSKISNLMITEFFYSHILNMTRSSLLTRSFRSTHLSVFRYTLTRVLTRIARTRGEIFNHEATASPLYIPCIFWAITSERSEVPWNVVLLWPLCQNAHSIVSG